MHKHLLAAYGLKVNPFCPDVPVEALYVTDKVEAFCWRVEQQLFDGGFAVVIGDPGTGKSVVLRILNQRLSKLRDVTVGVLTRPQGSPADFYRELGHLFGVNLSPNNRHAGAKILRETWLDHIDSSTFRPVLLIDEAQEMRPSVLCELRLLSSMHLDSRALLTIVLAGDQRLVGSFRSPDLLPIASRVRTRLNLDYAAVETLRAALDHLLEQAGNPSLMVDALCQTLVEHAAGNFRSLMTMGDELLHVAINRKAKQIDEALYLELFGRRPQVRSKRSTARQART
jgi:type II secretory pathway predicted ATPase ExeA